MLVPVLGTGEEGAISWVEIVAEAPETGQDDASDGQSTPERHYGDVKLVWRRRSEAETAAIA